MDVLDGVVAWVVSSDPKFTAKPAIQQRLQQLGAKIVGRLSKDVTHIVYERRQSLRSKTGNQDAELQDLYSRADKLDPFRPFIVSPSWVEESRCAEKRLVERKFVIPRPKEALLVSKLASKTPGSSSNKGKKRKQAVPPKPKSMDAYELGELFSSSQQIREISATDDHAEVCSPRTAGKRIRWREDIVAIQEAKVQEIKASPLEEVDTPRPNGNKIDECDNLSDDLDTPLSLRLAKSASRSASKEADRLNNGMHGGRSRLAQASGPVGEDSGDEDREMDKEGGGHKSQSAADGAIAREEAKAAGTSGVSKIQPAQRFSVRQLAKMEEKPLLVHKGTPLPGSLPPSSEKKRVNSGIPVPLVERVTSPWQEAEQLLSQSQSHNSQHAPEGRGNEADLKAQQLHSTCRERSQLQPRAGCSPGTALKPPAPAEAPWSAQRPWDAPQLVPAPAMDCCAREGACERSDSCPPATAGCGPRGVLRENVGAAGACRQPRTGKKTSLQRQPGSGKGAAGGSKHSQSALQDRGRQHNSLDARMERSAGGRGVDERKSARLADVDRPVGPSQGYIAITSVDAGVTELVKSAVQRLRGVRLCPEGQEDGAITHLVMGKERRTLKLMLAVANGAWLVTPSG